MPLDFAPATLPLVQLVAGVSDDELSLPTPCATYTVADLLDHISGLSLAFQLAAAKEVVPADGPPPRGNGANLVADWRSEIADRLSGLTDAWRSPDAWGGMTAAGGIEMPGDIAGLVAINEVIVHGWDLARATGQMFSADDSLVETLLPFVENFAPPPGTPPTDKAFDAQVPVGPDRPGLDRLVGFTGRDPGWTPPAG